MRTARASALLVGMALVLLPACSAPSLPTGGSLTDQTTESPPVHLVIDSKAANDWETNADFPTFVVALDPHTGHTLWRYQIAESANLQILRDSLLQPQVAGDLAIFAFTYFDVAYTNLGRQIQNTRGTIEALDLRSGQLRWHQDAGTRVTAEPVIAGSTLYVSSFEVGGPESGVVEALDRQSGKLLWSHPFRGTTGEEPGPPAVVGDTLFLFALPALGSSWRLLALKASDGSLVWDHTEDSPLLYRPNNSPLPGELVPGENFSETFAPAPLVGNQLVYVPSMDTSARTQIWKLLALQASDGKLAWEQTTGLPGYSLVLSQRSDMLCLVPANNFGGSSIKALDAKTGQTRWHLTTDTVVSPPATQGDSFYFAETGPIPSYGSPANPIPGDVFALANNDGHYLWRSHGTTPLSTPNYSRPPWVAHGLVGQVPATLGKTSTAMLVVFRADSGELVWQRKIQGTWNAGVHVEGDQVYTIDPPTMSGSSHTVTAYSLSTGAQLWTYETGHL